MKPVAKADNDSSVVAKVTKQEADVFETLQIEKAAIDLITKSALEGLKKIAEGMAHREMGAWYELAEKYNLNKGIKYAIDHKPRCITKKVWQ